MDVNANREGIDFSHLFKRIFPQEFTNDVLTLAEKVFPSEHKNKELLFEDELTFKSEEKDWNINNECN